MPCQDASPCLPTGYHALSAIVLDHLLAVLVLAVVLLAPIGRAKERATGAAPV